MFYEDTNQEKINILLVDDYRENLVALQLILDSSEYNLVLATSGEEALKYLLEADFALILMDVKMPGMDGFETARYIKQREKTRLIPIIFITAYGKDEEHIFQGYSAGAVDYIFKPIEDPVVLKSKVEVFVELHRKTKALIATEEKYRGIFENAMEGIYQVTGDGFFWSVNPSLSKLLGYGSPDRMIEKINLRKLYLDPSRATEKFALVERRGFVTSFESQLCCKDGTVIWVSENSRAVRDRDGEIIGFEGSMIDITSRKKSEDELFRSKVQLAAAQQILHIGSWEWEVDNDHFIWSEELYRIYDVVPEEVTFTLDGFLSLIDLEDREHVREGLEAALNNRGSFTMEYRILRRDGLFRTLIAHGEVLVEANKKLRVVGTAQDITEKKESEEKIRRSHEQLRALSAHLQFVREEERTRIAREIHDELGQSLTGLKMDLSWLDKRIREMKGNGNVVEPLVDKTKQLMGLIDSTIQTVRDISSELRPAILDLGLIPAIEWQAQEFQNRTGIRCIVNLPEEGLEVDRNRATAVFRILQETLTNVVRHANAKKVEIAVENSDDQLVVKVNDDGRGITEGEIYNNTSLGLIGMRERALIVGGDVSILGYPDKGTTVTVRVPIQLGEAVK